MRSERPSNEQQTFYVDNPTEDCVNNESGAWHNVGEFSSETEALPLPQSISVPTAGDACS
jgi:hypothetical protein